jgi:hypothetical protein
LYAFDHLPLNKRAEIFIFSHCLKNFFSKETATELVLLYVFLLSGSFATIEFDEAITSQDLSFTSTSTIYL